MSIRQQQKIRAHGCVHVNNNSGNAAIYAIGNCKMITGLLQNKYICISYKSKPQIKDLTRIFHVLIKNRIKNTALQNYVRLLVGRSIFGQH